MKFNHINLLRCVFLVKDSTVFFTQHHKLNVRPIKVYYQGHDVTRFLTSRTNLTNYTYQFIATTAVELRFSIKEVRSYLSTFKRAHIALPRKTAVDKAVGTELTKTLDPKCNTFSQRDHAKLTRMMGKANKPIREYTHSKFNDPIVFDAALKLAARNILPFRFNETRFSLFMKLNRAGFSTTVLHEFRAYLESEYPSLLSDMSVRNLITDLSSQYGYVCENTLCYSLGGFGTRPFPRLDLDVMFSTFVN